MENSEEGNLNTINNFENTSISNIKRDMDTMELCKLPILKKFIFRCKNNHNEWAIEFQNFGVI